MGIREIECDTELTNGEGQKLHRAWELDILNNIFVLERYGSFCGWAEIKLKKKGSEVYRIVKSWGSEERTEYFLNQPMRVYMGDQFSFVEYIAKTAEHGQIPSADEFVQAGLDLDIEKQYRDNRQEILSH